MQLKGNFLLFIENKDSVFSIRNKKKNGTSIQHTFQAKKKKKEKEGKTDPEWSSNTIDVNSCSQPFGGLTANQTPDDRVLPSLFDRHLNAGICSTQSANTT